MSTAEKIALEVKKLASDSQAEVLDFVQFLKSREKLKDERKFKDFSLDQAMRGMEEEQSLYDVNDIRETIK
jgi:hypothetical protein